MKTLLPGDYMVVRVFGRVFLLRVMRKYTRTFGAVYWEPRRRLPLDRAERAMFRAGRRMYRPGTLCWLPVSVPRYRLLRLLMGRPHREVFTSYNMAAARANELVKGEFTLGIWTVKRSYVEYGWPLI